MNKLIIISALSAALLIGTAYAASNEMQVTLAADNSVPITSSVEFNVYSCQTGNVITSLSVPGNSKKIAHFTPAQFEQDVYIGATEVSMTNNAQYSQYYSDKYEVPNSQSATFSVIPQTGQAMGSFAGENIPGGCK